MQLINTVDSFITKHSLIHPNMKLIVGLSGGPDSIFLLHLLAGRRDITVIGAHLDHQWRTNSAEDVQFCNDVCASYGIAFVSAPLSEFSAHLKYNGSREDFGRRARRLFLEKVRIEHKADAIILAHHLDDQQETAFIRLIRGTSLTGITAMRPRQGHYVRPLLEIKKTEILAYLKAHNISYLSDPTNESGEFLRNRIRTTVIPALRECDERFDNNFLATMDRLREIEFFLERLTREQFTAISIKTETHATIKISAFLAHPPIMQYRLIIEWLMHEQLPFPPTQAFLDEIVRFLKRPGSKEHIIHESWKIIKKKDLAWTI